VIFADDLNDNSFMLQNSKIVAFVGTLDAERAKAFYRDTLGLTLSEENSFALVFDANGTMLRVTAVHEMKPAGYTVLGWEVPDATAAVRQLASKGVVFSRYPGLAQDDDGIWSSPGGAHIAWFADPDGNVLSLTQF
jgi:catechol 2,3-dioxygenase-like lactoylglutathione lyase family enzyme